MPQCRILSSVTCGSSCGQANETTYYVYIDEGTSLENCGVDSVDTVTMSALEYVELKSVANYQEFDTDAYDMGYEAVLSSWVIGMGIGLILAMVAKLKR